MSVSSQYRPFSLPTTNGERESYQMIESLQITNFKGYKSIDLSGIPQFNFIVGPSGSGKTALLEALWMLGGVSPEIYFRARINRGVGAQAQIQQDRRAYESFFRDIFYNPEDENGAFMSIMDSVSQSRSLRISYDPGEQLELNVTKSNMGTQALHPIVFEWNLEGKPYRCPLNFNQSGQIVSQAPPAAYPAMLISSSHVIDASENAYRLSLLSVRKQKHKLLGAVTPVYPNIEDFSVEVVGGQQIIYASMKHVNEQVSLPNVSSGTNKFVSILLAAQHYEAGVLFIDEIENGFYFRDYVPMLKGIIDFCAEYRVQLFASTHSYELLECLTKVMAGREDQFSLLRTNCIEGVCSISLMSGISSKAALEQDIELR
jgi:AAA15 family ATPase/GTPase